MGESTSTCTWYMMRERIRPEWESPEMKHGGIWKIFVEQKAGLQLWSTIVLGVIGETLRFSESDLICGVGWKRKDGKLVLQLWHRNKLVKEQSEHGLCKWLHAYAALSMPGFSLHYNTTDKK
jgi:hypothetical protein